MPRIRTIKPEFWEDEKIATLPMPCRLFFIGMWNFADDAGVLRANTALLKSKIFPYDDIRVSEIQKYLDALERARMILPISHNGESFYVIRTFRSHQKFDARYPNYLIDKEILDELASSQLPPAESPTGAQRVPDTGKGGGGGKGRGSNPPTPQGEDGDAKTWRCDFQIYLDDLRQAYTNAIEDDKWIAERQHYHPSLNIPLTLERSCVEYWATEEGWLRKCKSKCESINWKSTFNKTIDKNRVYKPFRNEKATDDNNITF